jgi:hypothetical protein
MRGLLIFFAIFVLMGAAVQVGAWLLLKCYMAAPLSIDVTTSAAPTPSRFPPPNLQPTQQHTNLPWQDLAELRREKMQIFKELGWTTPPAGDVPIIPDQIVEQLAKERAARATTQGTQP